MKRHWELAESPLFLTLFPLTIGMMAGLAGKSLWVGHLPFFFAALLLSAAGLVAIHLLLHRYPYATRVHWFFYFFFWLFVAVFGLLMALYAQPHGFSVGWASRGRDYLLDLLQQTSLTEREQQMLSAVLLGDKTGLSPAVRAAFQSAGVAHLLALSGLHIGIITACVGWLLPKRIPGRRWLVVGFTWGYILLVGMPVSAVRTGLMLTLWLLNPYTRQCTYSMDVVALAAIILLLYNPLFLLDVGFQLSFAAVSAILLFRPSFRYWNRLPRAPQRWMWVCLAAQIGVLPFTLWHFGTFPTYFLVANLLITPVLMPAILYLGMALLLVLCICPVASLLLCAPLHVLFEIQWWIVEHIQQFPAAVWIL